jgi:choline kinase
VTTAVVLAAGLGRRLGTGSPKWLVPIGSASPAAVQLDALAAAGVERVVVVVGDQADAIGAAAAEHRAGGGVELVANDLHAVRNNWWSLAVALRHLGSGTDVLLLNSDLYASPAWLARSIDDVLRAGRGTDAALAVDVRKPLTDEAMKVSIRDGAVRRIGKRDVESPGGEYIGLAWWSAPAAEALATILEGFALDEACADHWYEHAIDAHLVAGADYRVVPTPSSAWVEIDDPADLDLARALAVDRTVRDRN